MGKDSFRAAGLFVFSSGEVAIVELPSCFLVQDALSWAREVSTSFRNEGDSWPVDESSDHVFMVIANEISSYVSGDSPALPNIPYLRERLMVHPHVVTAFTVVNYLRALAREYVSPTDNCEFIWDCVTGELRVSNRLGFACRHVGPMGHGCREVPPADLRREFHQHVSQAM